MKNNLLNEELHQMKYLFGYKPGRVISEQDFEAEKTKAYANVGKSKPKDNMQSTLMKSYCEILENFAAGKRAFVSTVFPAAVIIDTPISGAAVEDVDGQGPFGNLFRLEFQVMGFSNEINQLLPVEMFLIGPKDVDVAKMNYSQLSNLCKEGKLKVYDGPGLQGLGQGKLAIRVGQEQGQPTATYDLAETFQNLGFYISDDEALKLLTKFQPDAVQKIYKALQNAKRWDTKTRDEIINRIQKIQGTTQTSQSPAQPQAPR